MCEGAGETLQAPRPRAAEGVYFTPKAALDVIRQQPADIILANPPLEFATGSGGYLCEIAREMEGITPERMTI
jgi:hypothetical protein